MKARWKVAARFWSKLEEGPNGCLLWVGTRVRGTNYGSTTGAGERRAHRVAWAYANGPIPLGAWVLHRCDVENCCNPDHLFLGTPAANSRDMVAKGRQATGSRHGSKTHPESRPRGERHWSRHRPDSIPRGARHWAAGRSRVLTPDQIQQLRAEYRAGVPLRELGRRFKINHGYAGQVARGEALTHNRR